MLMYDPQNLDELFPGPQIVALFWGPGNLGTRIIPWGPNL